MSEVQYQPSILIVGASRGIGLGLVREYLGRGWRVIATERRPSAALAGLAANAGSRLVVKTLDIDDRDQISALADSLHGESLDVLIVNAGVSDNAKQTINEITTEEFARVMVTNALSPLRMIETLSPVVKAEGRVAAMSTALASISTNTDGGYETYRASKVALNMLLRSFVVRAGGQRSFMALMPGWVRTDMGGPDAPVEVEESVRGLADVIDQHADKPGLVFVDYQGNTIPW
jgi:NAD(P)-dependent dehydrogenase (short-subunit alcohol dehydrogenase family)